MVLVQVQSFETGNRDKLEILESNDFKIYASVAKGLKLKVEKVWELIPKFLEFTGLEFSRSYRGKTGRGPFCHSPPHPPHPEWG